MSGRLPEDAFEYYVGLGDGRSYRAVAERYGVSKRAVTRRATRDGWAKRLAAIAAEARSGAERRLVESMEQMGERHVRMLRVVQTRALEALRAYPLTTAMEAARALDLSIRQERVIRGEPSDRTAVAVEEVIRGEFERWMTRGEGGTYAGEEGDDE